jgi:iron complex outermembrane receptor protein
VCQASLPQHRFSYVPFTVGVDFTPVPSECLYAKVSRGYRAGGFNIRGGTPVELLTFSPENVTSYEIGIKSDPARKLRVDLALFYSDFRDIQLGESVLDPLQGNVFIVQNGGRARLTGGELELTALLGPLRFAGALGITEGRYLELPPNAGLSLEAGLGLPKTTASVAADLPLRTSRGELLLHADYGWRSDYSDAYFLARCHCRTEYGLLNARLTFTVAGTALEWGIWGRNLTDTHYLAQSVDFDYLINGIPGEPRTFGVSVRYAVPAH